MDQKTYKIELVRCFFFRRHEDENDTQNINCTLHLGSNNHAKHLQFLWTILISARGGYREATGIRRPPFRVRQRVRQGSDVCQFFGFSDRAGPMPPNPLEFLPFPAKFNHISPQFAQIRHVFRQIAFISSILTRSQPQTPEFDPASAGKLP